MQRKTRYLRLALATSILLALASSVALYYVALSVFTTLSFLGPLLPFMPYIVILLAVLAGIGGVFLIYNTLADIIIENKWPTFHNIRDWFSRGENESRFKHVFRIIASIAAILISLAAIAATGYTLYTQLLPILGSIAAVIVMLPCVLSEFIFIMKNSLESLNMLKGEFNGRERFKIFWLDLKEDLKQKMARENSLQWFLHLLRLPLQFVLFVFKLIIFMLHVGVTAVASDRLPCIPPFIVMIFSGISELLTDIFPLFGQKDDQAGHDHDHSGGPLGVIRNAFFIIPALVLGCLNYLFSQFNRFSKNPEKEYLSFKEAINQELISFEIRHSHKEEEEKSKQIAEKMLPKVYNSLRPASESVSSSIANPLEPSDVPKTQDKEQILLPAPCHSEKSLKNDASNPISPSNDEIATLPDPVIQWRLRTMLNQEIERLESKKSKRADEKITFFRKNLEIIEDENTNDSDKVKAMKDPGLCLAKHRSPLSCFYPASRTTASSQKWSEMQKLYEEPFYDSTSLRCAQ